MNKIIFALIFLIILFLILIFLTKLSEQFQGFSSVQELIADRSRESEQIYYVNRVDTSEYDTNFRT